MKPLILFAVTTIFSTSISAKPSLEQAQSYAQKGLQYSDEFPGLTSLCDIENPIRDLTKRVRSPADSERKKRPQNRRSSAPLAPTKVFDNLYFVGTGSVSSWVIKTSQGLIVIDALNNNDQAEQYIEKGLIELGLNPKDIKYLVITHGHGDHYGGQEFLVNKYQPRVLMSDVEWHRLEQPKLDFESPRWGKRPTRDISAKNADKIILGDTQVQVYVTPGHTPGTISLVFPVYDNGIKHMVSLWGGTGLNYGPDIDRITAYSEAAKQFGEVTNKAGVDIFLSNHPKRDGSFERFKLLNTRKQGEPHPFVIGKTQVSHAYDMLYNCTYAQVLKIKATEPD